jgi:hypothetical protein
MSRTRMLGIALAADVVVGLGSAGFASFCRDLCDHMHSPLMHAFLAGAATCSALLAFIAGLGALGLGIFFASAEEHNRR